MFNKELKNMDIQKELKKVTEPKNIRHIVMGLCIVIVALLIFQAGMFVGYRKASFSYGLGDNYYKTFEGRRSGGMMMGFFGDDMPGGHGVVGKIIKISLPTFVVESPDNLEKVVVVDDDTLVRSFQNATSPSDLKVDDTVIVLGTPNSQNQVVAKLIRVMPATTMMNASTTPKIQTQ